MGNGTFSALDMTTYCGLVELGLVAVGMRCQEGGFVLKCRAVNPARLCPGCGRPGDALGSRTRRLAHEPRGHQPTMLVVYVGRYRCRACSRSWCDDISQAAPPRAKLSFGALRWGLVCLIADNMSINRIAAHLAVDWPMGKNSCWRIRLALKECVSLGSMSTCGVIGVGTGTPR